MKITKSMMSYEIHILVMIQKNDKFGCYGIIDKSMVKFKES
jgi:hypothetical protein